jgi:hypothetical protein
MNANNCDFDSCARCGHARHEHVYREPIATEIDTVCESCELEHSRLGPFCPFVEPFDDGQILHDECGCGEDSCWTCYPNNDGPMFDDWRHDFEKENEEC